MSLRARANEHYERYVANYRRFARSRGFRSEINDWPYVRRSFIECWAEPGFHRFWQVWNPGIAYFVYRLFLLLGGRRRWMLPAIAAFFLSGLAHTLVIVPFAGHWSYTLLVTFTCFGLLAVFSRLLEPWLRQPSWPAILNVAVNVALVAGSFDVGFKIDALLSAG
jgi:hypothetical protein